MPSLSSKRLYLRGIPKDTTCEDLDKYLSCYGQITEVKVLPNCAFVQFESEKDALAVLETFRNQRFLGKHIVIEFAHPLRKDMVLSPINDRVPKVQSDQGPPMRFTVLVSDIPRGVRWQELKDFGRLSGSVVAFCDIDRYGNGFIEYFTHEDAKRAVTALDGKCLGGRRVHVEEHHSNLTRKRYRPRSRSPLRRSTSTRSKSDDALYITDERRPTEFADGWLSPSYRGYDYRGHRPPFSPSNATNYMRGHVDRGPYVNSEIIENLCGWPVGSRQDYSREHAFQDHHYAYTCFHEGEVPGYDWNEEKTLHSMDPYLQ